MIIPSSCHKPIQFVVTLLEHAPTKPVLNNNQKKKIILIHVKTVRKAFFRIIVIGVRTNATGEGAGTSLQIPGLGSMVATTKVPWPLCPMLLHQSCQRLISLLHSQIGSDSTALDN